LIRLHPTIVFYKSEASFTRKRIEERSKQKMGREKDRKLRRRKRRRAKLHKLKARLAQTKDLKERQRVIQKLKKVSLYPHMEFPED
jgi:hypothetical protein